MRRAVYPLPAPSILFALGLALWEVYFFWFAGSLPEVAGRSACSRRSGWASTWRGSPRSISRFQLISIPFALPSASDRFIGVVDGMASLVPLAVVLIVVFGKPHLIGSPAALGGGVPAHLHHHVDLFGGYTFNLALSRRTMDVSRGRSAGMMRGRRSKSVNRIGTTVHI